MANASKPAWRTRAAIRTAASRKRRRRIRIYAVGRSSWPNLRDTPLTGDLLELRDRVCRRRFEVNVADFRIRVLAQHVEELLLLALFRRESKDQARIRCKEQHCVRRPGAAISKVEALRFLRVSFTIADRVGWRGQY